MLIQLRGTSGSGKSFIVNKLMDKHKFKPVYEKGEIMGYLCKDLNLFIVGKYTTACGGCDSIPTQDEICRRVRLGLKKGWNVLFEGLICSHIAERYAKLYKACMKRNIPVAYIFLNTPLEKCRQNINKRRAKAGKPPVTAKNTEKDDTSTHRSRENMLNMGVSDSDMPVLSAKQAYQYILNSITKDTEDVFPFPDDALPF